MQINDNIKKARELKRYSQAKIAELLGEKRSTYAEWERSTVPKADVLAKISQITGVTMSDLLDEKPAINGRQKPTDPLTGAHVTLQDYIDELKDSRDRWYSLVNSMLGHIEKDTKAVLAHQKAWIEYEAEKASGGDDDKRDEIMNKMGKLVRGYLLGRASDRSQGDSDNEGTN